MPTYQYACTECDHAFEQLQKFTDDALTHCPVCDGRLRKVFNAVGVVFKGSGFYRTDSRNGSSSTISGKGTSGSESSGDSSGASSSGGDSSSSGSSSSSGTDSGSSSGTSSSSSSTSSASSAP